MPDLDLHPAVREYMTGIGQRGLETRRAKTPEERRAQTAAATAARRETRERLAELEAGFAALAAKVAELAGDQRIAA